ncbi:alpha/beta hydrolase [Bacillus carboniphilus]|uniref:Alpha/beta hydrolase n=1 Tax=Bacillus carboniphilus TaxID=86663 RepID=A0ABP3GDR8_9BACI
MHYVRKGMGEPLVLIHGFLGTHRMFEKVIDTLAKTFDVIAIDLPGHGKSPVSKDIQTVYDYAKEIVAFLQALDIDKATWIGHSLGGYIVYAATDRYSQHLTSAAAVYSTPEADDSVTKRQRAISIQKIQKNGIAAFSEERIPSYFADDANPEDVRFATELAKETSVGGAIRAIGAMRDRPDQTEVLSGVQLPFFILRGTKDQWDGNFHIAKPSKFVRFAETNTSHMGMLDNPTEFIEVLQEFLKGT